MSTFTENYDLIKPDNEDYYDIQDFNENMDAIDAQLAQAEEKMAAIQASIATAEETLAAINAKIGTPADGQSIFALLQKGGSVIRSTQRVVYSANASDQGGQVAINPVNPAKSFVFSERLTNSESWTLSYDYTLNSNSISVTHGQLGAAKLKVGFWVVEFL